MLQAEQQRPAFNEVRLIAVRVGLPSGASASTRIRRYWAKYSPYGRARWPFSAQIRFQPMRRRRRGIVGEKGFFGVCVCVGRGGGEGGGAIPNARDACCMMAQFCCAALIALQLAARHISHVKCHAWDGRSIDVVRCMLHDASRTHMPSVSGRMLHVACCHLARRLDASSYRPHARARARNMQALTLLSVWPWPMRRSCAKPLSPRAPTVNWPQLPRHTLCTAAAPHPSLQSVVGLQLERIVAAGNPTEKALLADVTEKNPDASYVELLRLFKVRRRVADGHS